MLAPHWNEAQDASSMKTLKLTATLLVGALALMVLASSAQAQRPVRGGGVTPPPADPPVVSPR